MGFWVDFDMSIFEAGADADKVRPILIPHLLSNLQNNTSSRTFQWTLSGLLSKLIQDVCFSFLCFLSFCYYSYLLTSSFLCPLAWPVYVPFFFHYSYSLSLLTIIFRPQRT